MNDALEREVIRRAAGRCEYCHFPQAAAELPFRTPLYPLPTVIFLVLISVLLFLLAGHSPREATLGVLVVLAGIPAFFAFRPHPLKQEPRSGMASKEIPERA